MANNDQRDTASYRNLAEQISQRMSEAGMSSDQLAAVNGGAKVGHSAA